MTNGRPKEEKLRERKSVGVQLEEGRTPRRGVLNAL
jgi:hypothetical protein